MLDFDHCRFLAEVPWKTGKDKVVQSALQIFEKNDIGVSLFDYLRASVDSSTSFPLSGSRRYRECEV